LLSTSLASTRLAFSLTRRPPPSTLVPYTTLFRSARAELQATTGGELGHDTDGLSSRSPEDSEDSEEEPEEPESKARIGELRRKLDRKSTRLNSSHVKISYAVFCLKKKNV